MEWVEWVDSSAETERWMTPAAFEESYNGNALCHTVGYVAKETEDAVVLAQSYSLNASNEVEEWGHLWMIPKVTIIRRKELQLLPDPNLYQATFS